MGSFLFSGPSPVLIPGVSTAFNTFTAVKSIADGESAAAFRVIPAGTLNPGTEVSIEAWGVMSNTATPTVILGLYLGNTGDPVVAGTGGGTLAVSTAKTTTTAMTNWEWHALWTGRVT